MNDFLDMQPGYRLFIRERKSKQKPIYCKVCKKSITNCPHCGIQIESSIEKGVDAAIITDLFSLYLENSYDIGILISSDSDYIPAVEKLQDKGIKIINGRWKNYGFELGKTCWASFHLDDIITDLKR